MTFNINVKNGTRAGWKREYRPLKDWVCPSCQAEVRKHWAKCPLCSGPRPKD